MTGVWRLLGADTDEAEPEQIVEYHNPRQRDALPEPAPAADKRILNLPTAGELSTMCSYRPQMAAPGSPGFSMKEYAGQLLARRAVIVDVGDLAATDIDEATRVVDYLTGVTEAVSGSVYEVAKNIFIFAPSNIALAGDPLKQVEVY